MATNGYFTFDFFNDYSPFIFDESSRRSLVAPFFADIDISGGIGAINYEIHNDVTSQSIISRIDSVISEHMQIEFHGKWLLVAQWDGVPEYGGDINTVSIAIVFIYTACTDHFLIPQTNTFQGILVSDFEQSFAVFTYKCGDLGFSGGATIGFVTAGGLFANHVATVRGNAKEVACLNSPNSPWVNVVYKLTDSCKLGNHYAAEILMI